MPLKSLCSCAILVLISICGSGQAIPKKPQSKTGSIPPDSKVKPQQTKTGTVTTAVDLAAVSLMPALLSTTDKIHGQVKLTGTIKNISNADYESAGGLQEIVILSGNKVVARKVFQNLAAGSSIKIEYSMTWNTATEFNPDYTLQINFDPAVFTDTNIRNNDKVESNNKKTLSAVQISNIFRQ